MSTSGVFATESPMISFDTLTNLHEKSVISGPLSPKDDKKILVLSPKIFGPLGRIAPTKLLKEYNVRMLKLNLGGSSQQFEADTDFVYWIVRPTIQEMKAVAKMIKDLKQQKKSEHQTLVVWLMPRKSLICERILKENGIAVPQDVKIEEFPLDLIQYQEDLLSMELDESYRECQLDGDLSSLYYVAKSLMNLQGIYGLIPHVKAIGDNSSSIVKMMLRTQRQIGDNVFDTSPQIHTLLLIDRKVDLVSPLLTQHTYEGLIDEFFEIQNGRYFTSPFQVFPNDKTRNVLLSPHDRVLSDIRDVNQEHVGRFLKQKAIEIRKLREKREGLQSVTDYKKFAALLPQLSKDKENLELHITISQQIQKLMGTRDFRSTVQAEQSIIDGSSLDETYKYIEECINKQDPLPKVLRLLCLISIVNNGLHSKKFSFFRNEILQTYGFQMILCLNNLEKLGFLCKRQKSLPFNWKSLAQHLKVISDEELDLYDVHQVHSGIAPLSIQLIRKIMGSTWDECQNLFKKLPGKCVRYEQQGVQFAPSDQKVVLVFFIGGATLAEVAAIRYLNKQRNNPYKYVIASTNITNGGNFMKHCMELDKYAQPENV